VHVASAPDFTGHVTVDSASFAGTSLAAVRGVVALRAAEMRTGIGLRDHHLRNAMEVSRYPSIRFELLSVEPGAERGDTTDVTYDGRFTIHGQVRNVAVPGAVVLRPGAVEATAVFTLDMRDYGIVPPTRFLGVVRVRPVVEVTVRLDFAPAGAGP
jgi:polyisoprenoid-binding protein YceI